MVLASYGVRVTTEECPVAVLIMSLQSIVGVIIQVCKHVQMYKCTYGHMYIFTCVHNVSQMRQHLKLKVQFLSATFRSNQQ